MKFTKPMKYWIFTYFCYCNTFLIFL